MKQKMMASAMKKQEAIQALQRGDLSKAESLLRRICKTNAHDAHAWFLLGAVNGQSGKYDEVITCCKKVLALEPRNASAYANIGNANASLGHHDEAVNAYDEALRLSPGDPAVLNNLANALRLAGRFDEAAERFLQVLARQKSSPDIHFNLASCYLALGRNNEALSHLQQTLALMPGHFDARLAFARLLSTLGRFQSSEDEYRAALEIRPDSVESMFGLASILGFQGKFDDAIDICEQILQRSPGDPQALIAKAELCEHNDRTEEAYEIVRGLIDRDQTTPSCASLYTRICRHYGDCHEAITLSHQIISNPGLANEGKEEVLYSLGALLDKIGKYDDAFSTFVKANTLKPAPHDRQSVTNKIDDIIATFDDSVRSRLISSSIKTGVPVFIIGMPRSGTSLIEQILASHPQVYGAGELTYIGDIDRELTTDTSAHSVASMSQKKIDSLAQQYIDQIRALDSDAIRITDKMPMNFLHLGLIAMMFPKAKIIHCRRDPRDTCLSIYFQLFNQGHSYANDLNSLGALYRDYQRLMLHWQEVLPLPMLEVCYEELIMEQERVSREIVAYCDLPWDDHCLQFHKTKRAVATASYDQVRQPIYNKSVGRWRNYESHLEPLFEALGDVI